MTDTPGRPPEPTPEEATEPIEPTAEQATTPTPEQTTEPATAEVPSAAPTRSPRRWLDRPNRLNRAAALVAIVAGAVVIVAGIFGSGVIAGAHYGEHRGGFERSGNHSQMSADRGQMRMGEVWIVPGAVGLNRGDLGPDQSAPPTTWTVLSVPGTAGA